MMASNFMGSIARSALIGAALVCGACSNTEGSSVETLKGEVLGGGAQSGLSSTRGWNWERDEGFLLANHTVPTLLEFGGGYWMFTSAPERGRIAVHFSSDGLEWEPRSPLDLTGLPTECGRTVLDVSVFRTPEGVRLVVETWLRSVGLMDPSGQTAPQEDSPTRFCALDSVDGVTWTPVSEALDWPGLSASWPSGLEFLPGDSQGRFFYVDTYPELDGIRAGRFDGGTFVGLGERETLLPATHVDPFPVPLEGGGVRLFHSRSLEGVLAAADSVDGLDFGESRLLDGLSGQVCYAPPERPSPPDACYLDPVFLLRPGGQLVLYFSVFESLAGGQERRGVGRAIAKD